jgi:hypothetical protein
VEGGSKAAYVCVRKHDESVTVSLLSAIAHPYVLPRRLVRPEIPLDKLAFSTDTPSPQVVLSKELEVLYASFVWPRKLAYNFSLGRREHADFRVACSECNNRTSGVGRISFALLVGILLLLISVCGAIISPI